MVSDLRVTHTLVLTEDTNKVWFKDLGWELAVEPGAVDVIFRDVKKSDWATAGVLWSDKPKG